MWRRKPAKAVKDEREGFQALFRGAMIGIRNPKAHEVFKAEDPQTALEYLGFASLLHRRIDHAEQAAPSELDAPAMGEAT